MIPPFTACRFNFETMSTQYHDYYRNLLELKKDDDAVLVLHEISNMSGHYAVLSRSGKIVWALHDNSFVILTDEEV